MARTRYRKKEKNGKLYYFFRLRHPNLKSPKDLYAPTVKELDEKVNAVLFELEHGIISRDLLGTFFCNWLFDVHCINKKPSTIERYESIYRIYVKTSELAHIKTKDLKAMDIQSYYDKLMKKGHSVSTIKTLNKLIAPSIRYAYNNNMILKDFSKAIVIPREKESVELSKESEVKPFTLNEQRKFEEAIQGHELEVLFLTALNSGLRQGELFALTWNDTNFDKEYITVNKTAKTVSSVTRDGRGESEIIIQTPKTKKSVRIVPIPSFLVNKHRIHQAIQLENKNRLGNLYKDNNLVFCTE